MLTRRSLLISTISGAALTGCAASITPSQLGNARGAWNDRRAAPGPKATLLVSVTGVRPGKGVVRVGLYDADTPFPTQDEDISFATVPAASPMVELRFHEVPFGTYALAAYQDLNGDGRLNTTFGVPDEPFGFSSGAHAGLTGTPSFREASFAVQSVDVRQNIAL